jgi:hypothetical protein
MTDRYQDGRLIQYIQFFLTSFFLTIRSLFLAPIRLVCAGHLGSTYFLCPYSATITVAIGP